MDVEELLELPYEWSNLLVRDDLHAHCLCLITSHPEAYRLRVADEIDQLYGHEATAWWLRSVRLGWSHLILANVTAVGDL